ncbi:MAG: T9SS type A sorting domain-containing protein [Candidatus Marinimicrobia bacterium]|nr:T9SS type A sorting domain-containing protein [Candidatus Neomarinimicrobiota bacterium]
MVKTLFWSALICIPILSRPSPIMAQSRWFEKARDIVDSRFSQGVATDGVVWYFSARQILFKINFEFDYLIVHENPIPQFLLDQGYDHIGDIAYFEGKLYAPIEDRTYVKPIIAIFDTASLNFTGVYALVPQSHIPWVAVDPRTGYFYSSEFDGVNKLFVYDPDLAFIGEVQLDTTLSRVQGGAFLGDFLYLACDNGDFVYEVDIASGIVNNIINVPPGPEMEGIEAYPLDSGFLHFVTRGSLDNLFYHYATPLAKDVTVSSIVFPEPKMPIWGKITPMAKIWNIGENTELGFDVVCIIDISGVELYRDTQTMSNLPSLEDSTIGFANWRPQEAASYNFTFYTDLMDDLDPHNDTLRLTVEVSNVIDDFEDGLGKWEFEAGWASSLKGQGNNGNFSMWSTPRPYTNNMDSPVTFIPSFDLSGFSMEDNITLSLWTKNRLEENKDFMYVEVSSDDENWSLVGSYTGRQDDWVESFHSLVSFSGSGNENVRIRFRLVTDASGIDSGPRIDDVVISSKVPSTQGPELHRGFSLSQSYPNPFNPSTSIRYELPIPTQTILLVYNLSGQEVIRLVDEYMNSGYHLALWDGRDKTGKSVASGIYFARLIASGYIKTVKMVLLR